MTDVRLTDEEWTKIWDILLQDPNAYVGKDEPACRRFVEAVKWVSRRGAQWRLLPGEYGKWNTVYKRFMRWCKQGVWERMLVHFSDDPDIECFINRIRHFRRVFSRFEKLDSSYLGFLNFVGALIWLR